MGNSLNTSRVHDALTPIQQIPTADAAKYILRPFKDKGMEYSIGMTKVETLTKNYDTLDATKIINAFRRGQATSINTLEFLTAVAMLSKGSTSECFQALFDVLDARDEKTITTDELVILIVCVFRALRVAYQDDTGAPAIGDLDEEYCEGEVEKWFPAADGFKKSVSCDEIKEQLPEIFAKEGIDLTVQEICERFKVDCKIVVEDTIVLGESMQKEQEQQGTSSTGEHKEDAEEINIDDLPIAECVPMMNFTSPTAIAECVPMMNFTAPTAPTSTDAEALAEAKQLLDLGVLSQDEFDEMRNAYISKVKSRLSSKN